jgi:hypothetical protein
MDIKTTYFSSDGVPRIVELTRDCSNNGWKMHLAVVSLRGNGKRMWLTGGDSGIRSMGWSEMTAAETEDIIRLERADLRRLFFEKGGWGEEAFECGCDFTGQTELLIEQLDSPAAQTAARIRSLIKTPMLVPPQYPFSVPLEITSGCSQNPRCSMCSMPSRNGRLNTIPSIKESIRQWAVSLGHLVASIQSVFLGRNSLPRPELLNAALEFLNSEEVYDTISRDLPPQLQEYVDKRRQGWGNIARFSAFATVNEINGYSVEELTQLREKGLGILFLSLETGSDRLRRETLGKNYSCAELEDAVEKVCRAGMFPRIIFMLEVGGEKHREEHVRETAQAIVRLQAIIDNWKTRSIFLIFLISPLDQRHMPKAALERIGGTAQDGMMRELNAIGHVDLSHNDLRTYLSYGGGMVLDDGRKARMQVYHYPMLFV